MLITVKQPVLASLLSTVELKSSNNLESAIIPWNLIGSIDYDIYLLNCDYCLAY